MAKIYLKKVLNPEAICRMDINGKEVVCYFKNDFTGSCEINEYDFNRKYSCFDPHVIYVKIPESEVKK